MRTIDERQGYCEGCGGIDFCTCNDLDWTEDDYDYPFEASMGRLGFVWCEQCDGFMEEPHAQHITESGYAEGW